MTSETPIRPQPSPTPRGALNRRPRRWLPYTGAVLLLAALVAGLWPRPIAVETARVARGSLRATVNEEGKTRLKQRYLITAPVAGQLRRPPFKVGAEVRQDETGVAVIDPVAPALLDARSRALAEARRDSARANLDKARANREYAAGEWRRQQKLYGEKAVSAQEWEWARTREATAAKEQAAAEGALRQAEAELEAGTAPGNGPNAPVEVRAPATGRVLRVFEENSRVVTPGMPLLELGDPTDLEVVIEVLSRDGAAIVPGAAVSLEQWGGAEPLEARVRWVEPAAFTKVSALGVEEQRVNVIADLVTPPERRPTLGDQFRVDARIVIWERPDALKVPSGGVFRRGRQWQALVSRQGRAESRTVEVGRSSVTETQILSGLSEGEEVILYPGDRVQPGVRVRHISLQ